jgi:hypothetical protein
MSYDPSYDPESSMYQGYEDTSWREDEAYDRMMQEQLDRDVDRRRLASTTGINPNEDVRPEVKNAA